MAKYDKPLDKDDNENGKSPARYRLPFALCKQRGIQLPDWATPRDAWNALRGFNINPSAEYDRLARIYKKKRDQEYRKGKRAEKILRKAQANDPDHSPDYNYDYTKNPGKIAGVQKGEPMTFEQADGKRANPYFDNTINGGELFGYTDNCQTCVVAFEARMRGYDVRALPANRNPYIRDLARDTTLAWIDPVTGEKPIKTHKKKGAKNIDFLRSQTKDGGRYDLDFYPPYGHIGHIVSLMKVSHVVAALCA